MILNIVNKANAQMGLPPSEIQLAKTELPVFVMQIVNYALVLVGVLALGMLVYGGFMYITAQGDGKRVEQAKNIIIYAIIGSVVSGVAAAVVNFVVRGVVGG